MSLPPRVQAIISETADRHGISVADLLGDGRTAKVALARHQAMRAVASLKMPCGNPTTTQIGAWFGRDHTSVLNALGRLAGRGKQWSTPRDRTKRVAWALRAPVTSCSAKLVLVVLAEAAGRDGTCKLGTDELADTIGMERRGVRYHLARLVEEGWLERQRRPNSASTFVLCDPRQSFPQAITKLWSGDRTLGYRPANSGTIAA